MRPLPLLIIPLTLAGCAGDVPIPTTKLAEPNARLMSQIKDLPPVPPGANAYESAAVCRAEYGETAGKARGLQSYVRTILGKKK